MKRKNVAVKLMVLDSNFDSDNVGEPTGVDMHAHKVAIVLQTDHYGQNGSDKLADLVVDLRQLKSNQVKGSTKLTAGNVSNKE